MRPNHRKKEGETMEKEAGELVERLEAAATLLERTLAWLDERQRTIAGEVERISATVETSRREEELAEKLAEAERELAELRASDGVPAAYPKVQRGVRKTLPSAAVEMLAKHGLGESAVDVRTLDAALVGLSLEQRIAVKSQLRRAGAFA
jgi:hypothetical protein